MIKSEEHARIENTLAFYEKSGWQIDDLRRLPDYFDSDFYIYSPTGVVFKSYDLIFNLCPFCDEDVLDEERRVSCVHDEKLLRDEKEAKNLLNLMRMLEEKVLHPSCLP